MLSSINKVSLLYCETSVNPLSVKILQIFSCLNMSIIQLNSDKRKNEEIDCRRVSHIVSLSKHSSCLLKDYLAKIYLTHGEGIHGEILLFW